MKDPYKIISLWNTGIAIVLLIGFYLFYKQVARSVPDEYALLVNILLIPFFVGFIGGISLHGQLIARALYIFVIPILSVLALEGDPTKAGLELILIGPFTVAALIGCGIGYGVLNVLGRLVTMIRS